MPRRLFIIEASGKITEYTNLTALPQLTDEHNALRAVLQGDDYETVDLEYCDSRSRRWESVEDVECDLDESFVENRKQEVRDYAAAHEIPARTGGRNTFSDEGTGTTAQRVNKRLDTDKDLFRRQKE